MGDMVSRQKSRIEEIAGDATEWRHELHRHPQTMYEETFASGFVAEKLRNWGLPYETGIAGTGIAATIEGRTRTSEKSIALRADMDALDILE